MKKKIKFGLFGVVFGLTATISFISSGISNDNTDVNLFTIIKNARADTENPIGSCNEWCGSGVLCVLNTPNYPIYCYGWQD